jgi:hypothetical protein
MTNSLTPYGYRHSKLSLEQRPVKDEAETSSDGTYDSDFRGLTAEEAKLTNADASGSQDWRKHLPGLPGGHAEVGDAEAKVRQGQQKKRFSLALGSKHHHGDSSFGGNIDDGGHDHEGGDRGHTHRPFTGGKPTFGNTNSAEYGRIEDKPAARDMGGEKFEHYDEDGEPGFGSDPDSEDPGGGYDEDEAPTPTAGNQRDAPELDKQHSDYPDEEDDFDFMDARRNDEQEDEEEQFDDEDPADAAAAGGPDEPDFHLDKAEQGFHNTVHGSSAASLALASSMAIVRKFSAGPAAIALAQPSDDVSSGKAKKILEDDAANGQPLTDKQKGMFGAAAGRADKAAPNVFRDDSPYGGGGGAGRASGGGGGGARQVHAPASRPQVGQSMGGARAGQPRGGMQPKRTIAYAEQD